MKDVKQGRIYYGDGKVVMITQIDRRARLKKDYVISITIYNQDKDDWEMLNTNYEGLEKMLGHRPKEINRQEMKNLVDLFKRISGTRDEKES